MWLSVAIDKDGQLTLVDSSSGVKLEGVRSIDVHAVHDDVSVATVTVLLGEDGKRYARGRVQ